MISYLQYYLLIKNKYKYLFEFFMKNVSIFMKKKNQNEKLVVQTITCICAKLFYFEQEKNKME
jgi:hypothetical protein